MPILKSTKFVNYRLDEASNKKDYGNKKHRLESLKGCSQIFILQSSYKKNADLSEDLAVGGFYYNDVDKTLKCFCCDLPIELKPGEDPIAKHWLLNSECIFFKSKFYKGPKMMEYMDLKSRIQSFGLWPRAIAQRPRNMAEAGFIYTGEGDQVQCFFCSKKLNGWEEYYDPWEEHAYYEPTCQFVIIEKGVDYVKNVEIEGRKGNGRRPKHIKIDNNSLVEEKVNEGNTSEECVMCRARDRNVCFSPCNHLTTCGECSFNILKCPVCREVIRNRIPIYVC